MQALPRPPTYGEWNGKPARARIAARDLPQQRFRDRSGPRRFLVVGGSLGARALNRGLPGALALLGGQFQVVRQAGERHLDTLKANYAKAGVQGELVAF